VLRGRCWLPPPVSILATAPAMAAGADAAAGGSAAASKTSSFEVLDCVGRWLAIRKPVAVPKPGNTTWRGWPHMYSKAIWKETMAGPWDALCAYLEQAGLQPTTCLICRGPGAGGHYSYAYAHHLPGHQHFLEMWRRVGDAPINREQWWHCWETPGGGKYRFNYIDGALEMSRSADCPKPRPPAMPPPGRPSAGKTTSTAAPSSAAPQPVDESSVVPAEAVGIKAGAQVVVVETIMSSNYEAAQLVKGSTGTVEYLDEGWALLIFKDIGAQWVHPQDFPHLRMQEGPSRSAEPPVQSLPPGSEPRPPLRAAIEGFWYGSWHPAVVRQHFPDQGRVEVLWHGEGSVSVLELYEIRLPEEERITAPSLEERTEAPALGARLEALAMVESVDEPEPPSAVCFEHAGLAPPEVPMAIEALKPPEPEESMDALEPGQLEVYREEHGITPSNGYLTPDSVERFAWICHMCRKKIAYMCSLNEHTQSRLHQKRRTMGYRFSDWVEYNHQYNFYESLAPSALGPRRRLLRSQ